MPIYDYVCGSCNHRFEVLRGLNEAGPHQCPECGGPVTRAFAPPTIHFKGSGWAKVDRRYSGAPTKKAAAKGTSEDAGGSKDSGGSGGDLGESGGSGGSDGGSGGGSREGGSGSGESGGSRESSGSSEGGSGSRGESSGSRGESGNSSERAAAPSPGTRD